jgi:hypothetical protein
VKDPLNVISVGKDSVIQELWPNTDAYRLVRNYPNVFVGENSQGMVTSLKIIANSLMVIYLDV